MAITDGRHGDGQRHAIGPGTVGKINIPVHEYASAMYAHGDRHAARKLLQFTGWHRRSRTWISRTPRTWAACNRSMNGSMPNLPAWVMT